MVGKERGDIISPNEEQKDQRDASGGGDLTDKEATGVKEEASK